MTDCSRFQDDLKAYGDGELSWPRRLAVRRHLTRCPSCRKEVTIMTQIAEDLRATEPNDALDPALRAKILGIEEPAPDNDRSLSAKRGGMPAGQGGVRKRPALGWAIAGIALVAWFVCYPAFQRVHEYARHASRVGADSASMTPTAPRIPVAKHLGPVPKPVTIQVRLSDREAGIDGHLQAQSLNATNDIQTVAGKSVVAYSPASVVLPKPSPAASEVAGDSLRQVHKEASIGVQVPNPEATSDTVETMVKETGGYVASNTLSTGDDNLKSAELVVKVPVAQFETFLSQTARLGNVQSKNISGEDITEKTSDADQEENVLEDDVQKSEARLKALGSRAKWHDEQATRDLRIQLAQSRARLVLLKRMAALGTITVDLSQTPPKAPAAAPLTGGFLSQTRTTTHDALQSLLNSANALLALVIWLLAYAPIWIPLLLIGRYALREYHKRAAV